MHAPPNGCFQVQMVVNNSVIKFCNVQVKE